MPIWKNLSGFSLAKICRSVYFDKSADNPTISSRSFAKAFSACPNGAGLVGYSAAIEAIIAEVVSFS